MSATILPASRVTIMPAVLTLAGGIAALIALFWPECEAAVRVWMESTAYGHCFLVLPIALYLIWDRRDSLHGLVPRPNLAFVLLGLPLPLIWLAAERLGIMEGRQLMAIAMLQILFLVVFGWRMYHAYSGPLLYLFFLVPFGLFLTPALQSFTAWFIDAGLNVLGIPHFITDMTIEISAGTFYVAEACAGLRFLIASMAFGVFFALLNFRSPGRRLAFMAASTIVPVIANGFRALGIVVLGDILGSAQAAAADHLIYGWFFFSFVTLLLVLAGLPFRQAPPPAQPASTDPLPAGWPMLARAALPAVVLAAIGPAAAMALDRSAGPARLAIPQLTAPSGCQLAPFSQPAPDRVQSTMTCGVRIWSVALQAVPRTSTAAALADARHILVGPIDTDEASTGTLPGASTWQTITSHNPGVVSVTTAWIDGQPALGGIRQRLLLARNSVLGSTTDPVTLAMAWRPGRALSEAQITAAIDDLVRFKAAQSDLSASIAQVGAHPN